MMPLPFATAVDRMVNGMRLFAFRRSAMARFAIGREAAFQSFWCAVYTLPVWLYLKYSTLWLEVCEQASFGYWLLTEIVTFSFAWTIWPLVMAYVADMLNRREHYIPYLIGRNWAIAAPILMSAFLITMRNLDLAGPANFLLLILQIWEFAFAVWLLRQVMKITTGPAIGLAIADIGLWLLVVQYQFSLLYTA